MNEKLQKHQLRNVVNTKMIQNATPAYTTGGSRSIEHQSKGTKERTQGMP